MSIDARSILDAVLAGYVLKRGGIHGISHRARVWENGLRLARETGADLDVVQAFALLHDSKRENDYDDIEHGPRAVIFAESLRGSVLDLKDSAFELLRIACRDHTTAITHDDPTIQTCWAADRLDLGRVGLWPEPELLCTEAARRPEILEWADARATQGAMPDWVAAEWQIDPDDWV